MQDDGLERALEELLDGLRHAADEYGFRPPPAHVWSALIARYDALLDEFGRVYVELPDGFGPGDWSTVDRIFEERR